MRKLTLITGIVVVIVVASFFIINKKANQTSPNPNQVSNETTPTQDSSGVITASQQIPGWNTYTHNEQGFAFDFPSDWKLDRSTSNSDYPTVSAVNSRVKSDAENREGLYSADFSVYYYDSISDEPENGDATTLDEFVRENPLINVIGPITLGGQQAIEVTWGGHGVYYAILAERNNHIYKLWFANTWKEADLTDIHKQIISSFRFID